ncbi:hypothetical protein R1flu_027136 [Riccia fluitans]|uniref:Uncharacterized protein n=1 Tax=Riccia fluitans TaxID=41844 RepID=A0ABD1XM15_9MARC
MRGATQTLLPFLGVVQPLERPNFTGLGDSEPRNDLSIKVWEHSVPEKLQIQELDARQRGKAILLATQEEASRASQELVDEEEAIAQAWWEGASSPANQLEWSRTKPKEPIRHA